MDGILNNNGKWTGSHDNNPIDLSGIATWKNESCDLESILSWTPNHFGILKCNSKHHQHSTICAYNVPVDTSKIY